MTGRPATEQRALATGQHGRHVAGLHARSPVPDAVHAPKFDEQRAPEQELPDLLRGKTGIEELRPRHHALLALRDPGHHSVNLPTLLLHSNS